MQIPCSSEGPLGPAIGGGGGSRGLKFRFREALEGNMVCGVETIQRN